MKYYQKNENVILKKVIMYLVMEKFDEAEKNFADFNRRFVMNRMTQLNHILNEPFDFFNAVEGIKVDASSDITLLNADIKLADNFESFISMLENNNEMFSQTSLIFLARRVDVIFERKKKSA